MTALTRTIFQHHACLSRAGPGKSGHQEQGLYQRSGLRMRSLARTIRSCTAAAFLVACFSRQAFPSETVKDSSNQDIRGSLIRLPWAEAEVRECSRWIRGRTYCMDAATEARFKRLAPESRIVHLATHAIVDDQNPLFSKLIFTQDTTSSEDGYLNTLELYSMDLSTDMVVLSACNTGYGKLVRGEGIMSLARGFMYAGSPSVIMSLWPVDDGATARLMSDFYSGLASGLTKDAALRRAKLNFLEDAETLKVDPFYWAGFISVGDTAPIRLNKRPVLLFGCMASMAIFTGLLFIMKKRRKPKGS